MIIVVLYTLFFHFQQLILSSGDYIHFDWHKEQ